MQVLCSFEISAAVLAVGVQKRMEQVIVEVVVMFSHQTDTRRGLEIEKHPGQNPYRVLQVHAEFRCDSSAENPEDHFINLLTIPPPIHVGLAQAQALVPVNPRVPPVVIDLDVPGILAVQDYSCGFRQLMHKLVDDESPPAS